ncbi:MAG: thiosulfate oxidation carrier protein SoxY [Candidatus Rokuibacteriota bacterium]
MGFDPNRRRLILGAGAALLAPRRVAAQGLPEGAHRVEIELPILSEEPAAVPIRLEIDHPMEPDHFIRSVEVVAERDPVPHKGTFLFTPDNGRPWVAFHMRSGAGGPLRAVAECSRHGRFEGSKELRVVEGGCTTAPDRQGQDRAGHPMLRLPRAMRSGQLVEVRAKVDHASHTGLALKDGRFVRESPEFFVRQMLVFLDERKVSEFQMTAAVSANPLVRFPWRARSGTLKVVFVNSEGQRWDVSQEVRI